MANCHELFEHYNAVIRLGDIQRGVLLKVREELRDRMRGRFAGLPKEQIGTHELDFESQGSFVMDTIIAPVDDDYDLDDGVYFLGELSANNRPTTQKFHDWVLYAVGQDENYAEVTDKTSCVRVRYEMEKFHIDLPIYYLNNAHYPDLAETEQGWLKSSPIQFIEWFENKIQSGFRREYILETRMYAEFQKWQADIRKADVQLRRIVRYLKGWRDNLRGEMPPGIVMTILAADNYRANERDDVSLCNTLVKIQDSLKNNGFKCLRPTVPKGEDLFADYSESRKQYFLDRLSTFVNSANQAIASPNQRDACLKWQRHLGNRFNCAIAKDEIEGSSVYQTPATITQPAKSA